ncbi:hypothetical protein ARTSIC4J27_215 [Pseudarthrobacter siccitolerans]|uniref:Uncharacterized protein n=1 Tax=Pseudarthrobacter siccitolerans TaxID=861266 RepID=A0A024GXT4_9MICC|nr:hypothetical protein ARTSIC4J27_215 [Pseudarthrobacter siccitolerans]
MNGEPPVTGSVDLIPRPAEEESTFILLPILDGPESAYMAVFSDGSYTRWVPEASKLQ